MHLLAKIGCHGAVAAALLPWALPAFAADSERSEIEEIIVVGTKQGLSVQDTVSSVSVYDEERMAREVVFELDDIFLRSANVSSSGFTGGLSIRGVARNGVGFSGSGNTSNIYINGAPISDQATGGIESLWDVAQVEILRGPQSTVQGRNSLAGAIVVTTKRPDYETDAAARVRYGELGTRQYSAAVGGGLIDGLLAGRVSIDHQEYDGEVEYASTGTDAHKLRGTTYRGSVLFEPVDSTSLLFIAERIETLNRDQNTASPPGAFGTPEQIAFDPFDGVGHQIPQEFDYEVDRFMLQADVELTDELSLVAVGTIEDSFNDRIFGNPFDLTQFPNASNATFDTNTDTKSAELRLEYLGEKVSGRVGAYYFEEDTSNEVTGFLDVGAIVPVTPPTTASIVALFAQDTENYAFFTEWRYEPNASWAFDVGVRYDNEENLNPGVVGDIQLDEPSCTVAPFVPGIGGLPCAALLPPPSDDGLVAAEFDAWLPRAAITYRFDEFRSLSFSVQRGYRAGGAFLFEDRAAPAGTPPELRTFGPEFIWNYEIALRSEWFDQRLLVNANAYLSDWTDQQVTITGPTGINDNETVNVGESELKGVEIEAQWFANDSWEFFATLGLSDTEFKDFPFAVDADGNPLNPGDPQFANLRGNEFQIAPAITGSVGAYYRNELGWFADVTLSYTDSGYSDIFNLDEDEFDAQTITNVRVGYGADRFRVFVYANNLFDDRASTESNFVNVNPEPTTNPDGSVTQIEVFPNPFIRINRPRVIGVQLEVNI